MRSEARQIQRDIRARAPRLANHAELGMGNDPDKSLIHNSQSDSKRTYRDRQSATIAKINKATDMKAVQSGIELYLCRPFNRGS
jgi:hypothetical protein